MGYIQLVYAFVLAVYSTYANEKPTTETKVASIDAADLDCWKSVPSWPEAALELNSIDFLWRSIEKNANWVWPMDWYLNMRFDISPLITDTG